MQEDKQIMKSWKVGKLESLKAGKLESWKSEKLESWKARKLESWKLESWKARKLESWKLESFCFTLRKLRKFSFCWLSYLISPTQDNPSTVK